MLLLRKSLTSPFERLLSVNSAQTQRFIERVHKGVQNGPLTSEWMLPFTGRCEFPSSRSFGWSNSCIALISSGLDFTSFTYIPLFWWLSFRYWAWYRLFWCVLQFHVNASHVLCNWIIVVVQHILVCNALVNLVVPCWPSKPFCPFPFTSSLECQPYVVESSGLGYLALDVIPIQSLTQTGL